MEKSPKYKKYGQDVEKKYFAARLLRICLYIGPAVL